MTFSFTEKDQTLTRDLLGFSLVPRMCIVTRERNYPKGIYICADGCLSCPTESPCSRLRDFVVSPGFCHSTKSREHVSVSILCRNVVVSGSGVGATLTSWAVRVSGTCCRRLLPQKAGSCGAASRCAVLRPALRGRRGKRLLSSLSGPSVSVRNAVAQRVLKAWRLNSSRKSFVS